MANVTKGFNFNTVKDEDVLNHIYSKGNGSAYIKRLVRADMNKEDIRLIIKEILQEESIQCRTNSSVTQRDIDVDSISEILNMGG